MTHLAPSASLRALLLAAPLAIGLAACGVPTETETETAPAPAAETRTALVTSAFAASGRAEELAFIPNAEAPWTGLIAASLAGGGFDVFDIDGQQVLAAAGPRLRGLAAAPDFPLRGERFPLLFGVDDDGALRGFAMIRETRDVLELPLEGDAPASGAAGVCLFDVGIGYVELAVLSDGLRADILRVRDTGSAGLTLERQARRTLPFPARNCARAEDDLLVAGPTAGLARVDADGATTAFAAGLSASDVAYTELLGRPAALIASAETGRIEVYDARTLDPIAEVQFDSGLSAPAFQRPIAIALTEANYGGMAFSTGVFAVYDQGDARLKLVARDVISRAVVAEN